MNEWFAENDGEGLVERRNNSRYLLRKVVIFLSLGTLRRVRYDIDGGGFFEHGSMGG